ncbi:hypothetical protein MMEU_0825 [Mycobacterium marinum str. Europe]|nr:hypothetical protein MMEU_0825 [Mycobacterium marinum str. Europe]
MAANTTSATQTAGADQTRISTGTTATTSTSEALTTGSTGSAGTPQPGPSAGTAGSATQRTLSASTAGAAVAVHQPATPADTATTAVARRADSTRSAGAAVAKQPGRPAGTTGLTSRSRAAGTTVTPQQAPGSTSLAGPWRCIHAVADQRTSQPRLCGRINRVQRILFRELQGRYERCISRLRADINSGAGSQRLHKLFVKRRHPGAERLIFGRVSTEQRRNRHRHLIGSSGQHRRGRSRCRGIGRPDRRPNPRQVRRGSGNQLRRHSDKRHSHPQV